MERKTVIYIDMDDVLCDYTKAYNFSITTNPSQQFPQSELGFFTHLKPIKDAINSVNFLLQQPIFDIYILTAPSVRNAHCYTEKRLWIENYFDLDFARKLIIATNKSLLKGDFLIDDHNTGRGQENFGGTLLQFGTDPYNDWASIIAFFTTKFKLPIKRSF